ncbi:MAG: triosephosphate isomerase [Patescibacteria group bacterium]|nr:MAG: triosephosphate isomerase [Patescibacteria group bacterium]GIW63732.1 MAG: triosephosphate isomerase [Patescibacteria group bacterium]GIW64042.1 MAG: triosephosphate isomerase [Patescibacteria group bacterium]
MKEFYIIANWKARLTLPETSDWLNTFKKYYKTTSDNLKIILAPSATNLHITSEFIKNNKLNLSVSAQDVSSYPKGAYTGEVPAELIKSLAEYAIIGHSERRRYFNETTAVLEKKLKQCRLNNLTTIYCFEKSSDALITASDIIAFEPRSAIGTGKNLDPDSLLKIKQNLSISNKPFLYGGSVNLANALDYLKIKSLINGFLISSASLNPIKFAQIIELINQHLNK